MPKALLTKFYDQNSVKKRVIPNNHYTVSNKNEPLVKVVMAKEIDTLTKHAGWGLKALTFIPKNRTIGFFKKKGESNVFVDKKYCFPFIGGRYFVAHEHSLMNIANTIPYNKQRLKLCNAKIVVNKTEKRSDKQVSIRATEDIKPGKFIWVNYGKAKGETKKHYWLIQYQICKARLSKNKTKKEFFRNGTENDEDDDNDDQCRKCRRRHEELIMCDTCPVAVCYSCMSKKEKYLHYSEDPFFCDTCLETPKKYPNRFRKKTENETTLKKKKKKNWLRHANDKRYLSTYGVTYDLDEHWKKNHTEIINTFKTVNISNVEFINFKGSRLNDNSYWTVPVVEALVTMLERNKTRCYGINLGEIYFEKEALIYLHNQLRRTWIGFIYIDEKKNRVIKHDDLVGCFRHTYKINRTLYPSGSNLAANRREKPLWHKHGEIAPWFDMDNFKWLDTDVRMGKMFWSSLRSKKHFGENCKKD